MLVGPDGKISVRIYCAQGVHGVSYGTVSYFDVNTFKLTNDKGKVTYGRYQIRPLEGDQSLRKIRLQKLIHTTFRKRSESG